MPRTPPITYQLVIALDGEVMLQIGRLGRFRFPAGRYVYTGSAKRNLEARIARHLSAEKRLHWHIDWLLQAPQAHIVEVHRSTREECALNRRVGGTIVAPGFGASDCRAGCGSHLRYLGPV